MPIAPYLRNELLPTDTTHFALSGEQLLNRFKTRLATASKKGGRTAPASRVSCKGFPFARASVAGKGETFQKRGCDLSKTKTKNKSGVRAAEESAHGQRVAAEPLS